MRQALLDVAGQMVKRRKSAKNFGPATFFCFCGRLPSQVARKTQTCDGMADNLRQYGL
jgi:hypothetical protein